MKHEILNFKKSGDCFKDGSNSISYHYNQNRNRTEKKTNSLITEFDVTKDLYQVQETWKFFFFTHSIVCALFLDQKSTF